MSDQHAPPFGDVFGDGLFLGSTPAAAALGADDLAEAFTSAGTPAGAHVETGAPQPRFVGDTSQLAADVSWTLQELVVAPHIAEGSRPWAVLLQYEDVLRSRLSELGLALKISREYGYAHTEQADDPSPRARVLLRARTLSLAASALALYLYNQYLSAPDDPVVETTDMIEHMLGYKPPGDTDEAGFVKRIRSAIRALEEVHVIRQVPGTSRYVIYPVITALLSAERVQALTAAYQAIAARGGADPADEAAGGKILGEADGESGDE
jgi:hypothetical protein